MRYVIVTGGPLPEEASDVIRSFAGEADTKVIACDSGCDHLAKTGIVPDVVIGDMDSITKAGLDFIKANSIPVEKYPVEKDWTDTEIGLAVQYRSAGRDITVTDGITTCRPLTGEDRAELSVIPFKGAAAVSLIPFSFDTPVTGVTTEGLYYPLTDAVLNAGSSFSFSNHPVEGAEKIAVSIR